jgi:hypothetical protein
MKIKAKYELKYLSLLDNEPTDLIVEVELKMVEGMLKYNQNVYYCEAMVDGKVYTKIDLSSCINPKFAAEEIGNLLKEELIQEFKKKKKLFRIIKENLI